LVASDPDPEFEERYSPRERVELASSLAVVLRLVVESRGGIVRSLGDVGVLRTVAIGEPQCCGRSTSHPKAPSLTILLDASH
jgi:hypothetical protein